MPIAVKHVGVVELIGPERSSFFGDLSGPAHHRWNQLRCDALWAWNQFDVGAECLHRAYLLGGEGIRGHHTQRVALHGTDKGKRGSGAASAVFDDRLTWL
jgi:hypothetical protein